MNDPDLLAALAVASAVGLGLVAYLVGRVRRWPSGDRPSDDLGDLWTGSLTLTCTLIGLPVLLSGWGRISGKWWNSGWHLHSDIVSAKNFPYMLFGPVLLWGVFLLIFAVKKPGERQKSRWLAGTIGHGRLGRRWALLCGIPVLVLAALGWGDLGGGSDAYPGAAWSTMVVSIVSLVGLAWSAGGPTPPRDADGDARSAPAGPRATDWPTAMAQQGFELELLHSFSAAEKKVLREELLDHDLPSALSRLARQGVSPVLVNTVHRAISGADPSRRAAWLRGPDHCGQLEVVAAIAGILAHRYQQTTMVITARGAAGLAGRLRTYLPASVATFVGGAGEDLALEHRLWVVDADLLSDRLLPELSTRHQAAEIGLVVWWDLQDYTGVYAANMWAISRRLQRIMTKWGRLDAATLAFSRKTLYGHGQAQSFVTRILPIAVPPENVVDLEVPVERPFHLYRLKSCRKFFNPGQAHEVNPQFAHPSLLLGLSSVNGGWKTALELPEDTPFEAVNHFRTMAVGERSLGEALAHTPAEAEITVSFTDEEDILSLVERVCQAGRKTEANMPHHVAVLTPMNPYANWLLGRLTETGNDPRPFPGTRRLVGAESNPELIKRHLLKALAERADIRTRLLSTFVLMNEEVMRSTLAQLARAEKLKQDEVRYLNGDRLVIDHRYRSLLSSRDLTTSLDTVGFELIEVKEAAGGALQGGVRMRVDRERLAIQAYPGRIFFSDGVRYRVREWHVEELAGRPWVRCVKEGTTSKSWRTRRSRILHGEPQGQPHRATRRGRTVVRQSFQVVYKERVTGCTRLTWDLATETTTEDLVEHDPLDVRFSTRGVLINLPQDASDVGIISLCECLRIVLPVHLGVNDEAVELVPVVKDDFGGVPVHGLFIVDLYPGGIGLVDAFQDDDDLWLSLLDHAHRWLSACPCQEDGGCPRCLHWIPSKATRGVGAHTRRAALELLEQVAPLEA